MTPRLIVTSGEPAGIGPDLCLAIAERDFDCELVVAADIDLLKQRAALLKTSVALSPFEPDARVQHTGVQHTGVQHTGVQHTGVQHKRGVLRVLHVPTKALVAPGALDPRNAGYVLDLLNIAANGCLTGQFDAMVTAPVQKSVINDAGIRFSGHTEYLAERSGGAWPVMMLVNGGLRVALATTHLPLVDVSAAITRELLRRVLRILHRDLQERFGFRAPRILVCGLNPHAGESGHLGREEIDVIGPALTALRAEGLTLIGPAPADTAFTPHMLQQADAVLAMYHDQGLPVIKYAGFSEAVNVTLGLPIVRTSVDHGTALSLAGTGKADASSLTAAVELAIELASRRV